MPEVISSQGVISHDDWVLVERPAEGETLTLPSGPVLVPLDYWAANAGELSGRGDIGVWLDGHDDPDVLAAFANDLPVIAINFPKFSDGRGYSTARLLRERHGYRNDLRAVGDVLLDQLQFMKRCGFSSFVLRADKDIGKAASCLNFFSQGYQAATDTDEPLFRRRA
ncbi:DUF934 domain-containing protein [Marinobacter sp. X15-166B]|uniref:DUF934 domain-containing protein n=1 Tax=Marinobacter sp. X15-166B TaxID=1897620 RepID=UPI00085BD6CF|nr:DUF934 domain-containing protein [Marinobacter sp. X15-166B]OEY67681.1 oxidoreductase [Marinobacter sp. X15-166B]